MWKQTLASLIIGIGTFVFATTPVLVKPEVCVDDPEESLIKCPDNEVYSKCRMAMCTPLNCKDVGKPIACPMIKGCCRDGGCVCKSSYARSDNGTCIPIADCPCNSDPNAVKGCGNHCGNSCNDYNSEVKCPRTCLFNGCDCRKGHVYDPVVKRCVLPKDCTPKCPANEFFTTCKIAQCRAQDCSQLGKPVACASIIELCNDPACVCNYGYARHDNGTCIPVDRCPLCNEDPNAQSGCGNHCENSCDDYNKKGIACNTICVLNGCQCKPGFVYNKDMDRCVEPKDCQCKKKNEEFYKCLPLCPPEGCDYSNILYRCASFPEPGSPECKPGCRCKGEFYRNKAGDCVPKEECEINKCNKDNEEYYICSEEEIKAGDCENSCRCVKGYYRNENGVCAPKSEECPANEYYEPCINSQCRPQYCSDLGKPIRCFAEDPSDGGCICIDGYVRNDNRTCIPIDKCPTCNEDPNAVSGCVNHCGNSCHDYDKNVICTKQCRLNGCKCKPGYVYNKEIDRCVLPKNCPCKIRNEKYYECVPSCPPEECASSRAQFKCAVPPKPGDKRCKPGCRCEVNKYYRNDAGECVPKEECEIYQCTKENEEYYTYPKEDIKAGNCENSCKCVKGYVRNKVGDCVLENNACPANEEFIDRPTKCPGESCSVDRTLILCGPEPEYEEAGCRCKPGFCRYKGKCTTQEELDSQCNENETFKECASHCTEGCNVDPRVVRCAMYQPGDENCPPDSCVCIPGYCRDDEGNCVKSTRTFFPRHKITPVAEAT